MLCLGLVCALQPAHDAFKTGSRLNPWLLLNNYCCERWLGDSMRHSCESTTAQLHHGTAAVRDDHDSNNDVSDISSNSISHDDKGAKH